MKKLVALFAVVFMAFSFGVQPTFAAEGDPVDPPVTEEPINYQEEVDELTADVDALVRQGFAYIGGFAGISALAAYGLRFIKDRKVMKKIQEKLEASQNENRTTLTAVNGLVETVQSYVKRNQALEKSVIHLITMSNLDSSLKAQVIEGLNNDTITVQDVVNAGLLQVEKEVEQKADIQAQVNAATTSLLEQLNKDSEQL